MADRQTALAVFDFLDSLRAGQYRIGADAEKDHATAGLLASLSGDTGLRDAGPYSDDVMVQFIVQTGGA